MIELEPIKQIKSPSSENVIIFALRCVNYMIINDKLNGLIVLDLEWREVNRIYIGEQLLLIEAIYTDMVRNKIVFKLESSLCVNVNIRMYNFDDVQCTVIPSVAYGFVTGMNLQ
ncbi:MAG: hypothetical protein E6187_08490, partial [Veillonella sp.]|nr:hypothetical protein [Veillonella sp.]